MDVTGMIAELRLELDRIERSILILDTLASPSRKRWPAAPLKHKGGSQAAFASRAGKVISIARGKSDPLCCEDDLSRNLRELRTQADKFQKAISTLVREPAD
jgi:hypothetical protein